MLQRFIRRSSLGLVSSVLLAATTPAWATTKIFNFDTAAYGTPDANCVNSPVPPLFNRAEYGSQTAAYIENSPACGNGTLGGNAGSDSLLTGFFSASSPNSEEIRYSWVDPTNDNAWLRLITFSASSVTPKFPNPTVDFRPGSKISLNIAAYLLDATEAENPSGKLEVGLAIRETDLNLPLGADGGTTGTVEFVGFTGKGGGTDLNTPNGGTAIDHSPTSTFTNLEWEFIDDAGTLKVNVRVNGVLTGDSPRPIVGFSGDGILSTSSLRGTLDSLVVRKPIDDDVTKKVFLNVDDVTITSPVLDPVQVLGPVLEGPAASVTVAAINLDDTTPPAPDGAEEVRLYKRTGAGPSYTYTLLGSAVPPYSDGVNGKHTLTGLSLAAGDVLVGRQVIGGAESGDSAILIVSSAATWTENFDSYANQAAFGAVWLPNNTTDPDILLQTSVSHSCPNAVQQPGVASGATIKRRYRDLGAGGLNGSDTTPLWFTFYMYHGNNAGQRNYIELRRYASGAAGGTLGSPNKIYMFGCYNSGVDTTKYNFRDYTSSATTPPSVGYGNLTIARTGNTWHKMQIKLDSQFATFYVDGVQGAQIPRVDSVTPAGPITTVVIGSGLSNASTSAYYDSMSFSLGTNATDPFGVPAPPQVAVQGPLAVGQTVVTVTGVNTAPGTTVFVSDNGTQVGSAPANGSATVNVTVPALVTGHSITAVQQLADNTRSCTGPAIIVNDCAPVAAVSISAGPLSPATTSVVVAGSSASTTLIKVYKITAGVPTLIGSGPRTGANTTITLTGTLAKGDQVAATQVINTVEGCVPLTGNPVAGSGTNGGILMTLGIREDSALTGNIGDPAPASSGAIEWLFPAGSVAPANGGAPQGKLVSPSPNWQTVTFDPTLVDGSVVRQSNISAVADDGILNGPLAILEHLGITHNGPETGPYVLYIDNVMNGTTVIEDFEARTAGNQVLFRQPTFSGTTGGNILSTPSSSAVDDSIGDASSKSAKIQWQFRDEATSRWIRLTTSGTPFRPNPIIDLTQPITIRFLLLDSADLCPADPNKTAPGVCGCGVPDTDTDGDTIADCVDGCPNDPAKTAPGACGCGVVDTDTDGDTVADCVDNCPNTPNAGQENQDGDAQGDACDACPTIPNPCPSPRTILAWRSVRSHSGLGPIALALNATATGNGVSGPTTESRGSTNVVVGTGIQKVQVQFSAPITLGNAAAITVTGRTTVSGVMGAPVNYTPASVTVSGGDTLEINFNVAQLPDESCYNVAIGAGAITEGVTGDADCNIRSLLADVNMDGQVVLGDSLATKARVNQLASAVPQFDANLSGGQINLGDALFVKTRVSSNVRKALCP